MSPAEDRAAQSVRRRLLNRSRATGEDYNLLLTRYAVERLLYRLSRSAHAGGFVLKGAMLFMAWTGALHRPTRDLDLLGSGEPSPERLVRVFREVCAQRVLDDGMKFDAAAVQAAPIRDEHAYAGIWLRLAASLGSAKLKLQVDVGFGDVVTPEPQIGEYPTLLDQPAPQVRMYPPESVVAEKLEATVSLGIANTRMKDFYDSWFLLGHFELDDATLAEAIRATFGRRGTPIPSRVPLALTDEFSENPDKQRQWIGFVQRSGLVRTPELAVVVHSLRARLVPLLVGRG